MGEGLTSVGRSFTVRVIMNHAVTPLRLGFVLVLLAGFAAHWTALEGEFVFDDVVAVVEHPSLAGESLDLGAIATEPYWGARPGYERNAVYRPVVTLSFALNAMGAEPDPQSFRWVNLLLHVLAGLLAWRFASLVLADERAGLFAGLLFAVHPVHSEAVASAANRTELLAAVAVLGALLCHFRSWKVPSRERLRWWLGSAACTVIALGSKESAITIPAALLVVDAVERAREGGDWRSWRPLSWSPLLVSCALVGLYLGWRMVILTDPFGGSTAFADNPMRGADGIGRWGTPFRQFFVALEVLFFPVRLSADYSFNALSIVRDWSSWDALIGACVAVGSLVVAVRNVRKRPALTAGIALFWVWYVLTSNLVVLSTIVFAERLLYLPSLGVFIALGAWLGPRLSGRGSTGAWTVVALLCVLLGGRSLARDMDWATEVSLFESSLEARPGSSRLHVNLGRHALDRGDLEEARVHLEAARRILPGNAQMLYNAGVLAARLGEHDAAERDYRAAIRGMKGAYGLASSGLCALGVDRKLPQSSVEDCETAVRLRPHMALAWSNLGRCRGAMGQIRAADLAFARALELEPDNVLVLNHRGSFLQKAQRLTELLDVLHHLHDVAPPDPSREGAIIHLTGVVASRHLGRGNPSAARACIDRAAARFGNTPELNVLRSQVQGAAGAGFPR